MPHTVEIDVRMVAKTRVDGPEATKWLKGIGVSPEACTRVIDPADKSDAEMLVELAGRRCYKSFEPGLNPNIQKIREDIVQYIDNILASGHGSVLEHVNFTFAIENVSRVFTGEMNRHRAGMAISEGSMRFIRYDDIGYWLPTSISGDGQDERYQNLIAIETAQMVLRNLTTPAMTEARNIANRLDDIKEGLHEGGGVYSTSDVEQKKARTRSVFTAAFSVAEWLYGMMNHVWQKELAPESKFKAKKDITSMMRRIIPMGVATGGVWTGNIRALRHIFGMRCSPAAEEEILLVATKMLNIMRTEEPSFFGDYVTGEDGYSKPKHWKV